jgi:type 1 fimbria pilin
MKMSKIAIALFGAALLFSSGAIAKDTNKATLVIADKLNVEGKTVDPGTYKVEWDGNGPTVQVTLLKGKQTVTTFSAHVTEQASKNPGDAYGAVEQADGSKSLSAIYPGGKHAVLEVDQAAAANRQSSTLDTK